ncbi:SAM-dependent methyltransferase [Guptibacillus hwajinpoensis]|uniref:SAM-dependent methyltransferase n=1 Tax=Guptibacillus hwajinpoensis TaxID=208199 RepID=UPI001CFF0E4C|nr:SAM-dependent methyltransferase [Pseudalkalibacillus hwajinpoensis]
MSLKNIIINEIERSSEEFITFERFMTLSLYHPKLGYYQKDVPKTGIKGDFITSTSVHDVYSRVMARVLINEIQSNGYAPIIVDAGSGDGKFISSFLDEVKFVDHQFYEKLTYFVLESSPYHQQLITNRTKQHDVEIFPSLTSMKKVLPKLNGILFSNELLDAFPVRVIEKQHELVEVCVGLDENNCFTEVYRPCTDPVILNWTARHQLQISDGQRIEIPLAMGKWLDEVGNWLANGKVITVDYGYTNEEWKSPERKRGSLRGYRNHQLIENVLQTPGEMDITTHVHIDAIKNIGLSHGMKWVSCMPQGEFLLKEGLLQFLQQTSPNNPFSKEHKQNRAIRWLAESNQFLVMIQEKRQ